ncbi:MAG: UDP-glucose/GDP-mannose dehydrogenase family protein [Anaerolineae bacterium]|nr:UDP-glucose/GDP-mannose dehydrogenase family protein [Thermoflexus sp.]MDW8065587.1 UDP-glucose/GDP-mannose dehydrogenase family protein [Anaerolineae bacterium]
MKRICVIGAGYVGLTTAACMADLGNRVTCVDINEEKIVMLQKGRLPIFEPGLEEIIRRNMKAGRLFFTTSYEEGINRPPAEFIFIAVGTPEGVDGEADLRYVRIAAERIGEIMDHPLIIVNKSTVPVGTGDWVADIVRSRQLQSIPFWVVSNPEFLREGSAVYDFMNPDRIVLGSLDREAAEKVAQLYLPLRTTIMITDLRTAEMIKYASNAFLATKISFINEIANICEALGADVKEVAAGMGFDKRIGRAFLDAGVGWGGSCFPKDVKALIHMAIVHGCHPQLLQAVVEINRDQRRRVVEKLREILKDLNGLVIGLLGLSFKPNTDDIREAPSLEIASRLLQEGAIVRAYDPVAMSNAARAMPSLIMCADPYELADGADALVVVTDWNEFKHLDLPRIKQLMRQPVIVDGRNIYEPEFMRELGFIYRGIGRGYNHPSVGSHIRSMEAEAVS